MKRIVAVILAGVLMISSLITIHADVDWGFWCADVNGDDKINAEDALMVLKYASKLIESLPGDTNNTEEVQYVLGDVTGDNKVNAEDALDILKYSAKIIDRFKISDYESGTVIAMYQDLTENVEKDVTLGKYIGIEIEVEEVVVTDEDVQDYIDSDLEYYGTCEEIKEGVVEVGDTLNIDYFGTIDGVDIENGWETGAEITIGSGSFIDGFEDSLVGKNIGKTAIIYVTFPEDYSNEDLAGKLAEFAVTINYKYGELIPAELTDELVRQMGYGESVTTVAEYKQYIRESLQENADEAQKNIIFQEIMNSLLETCSVNQINDPSLDIDKLYEEEIEYMKDYAEQYAYSYEEFVELYTGMTAEEYEALLKQDILDYVKKIMIYRAVAKAENIIFSQEEYEEELASYSVNYKSYGCKSVEEFEELYGKQIFEFMIYDAVENLLYDSAIVTVK